MVLSWQALRSAFLRPPPPHPLPHPGPYHFEVFVCVQIYLQTRRSMDACRMALNTGFNRCQGAFAVYFKILSEMCVHAPYKNTVYYN